MIYSQPVCVSRSAISFPDGADKLGHLNVVAKGRFDSVSGPQTGALGKLELRALMENMNRNTTLFEPDLTQT